MAYHAVKTHHRLKAMKWYLKSSRMVLFCFSSQLWITISILCCKVRFSKSMANPEFSCFLSNGRSELYKPFNKYGTRFSTCSLDKSCRVKKKVKPAIHATPSDDEKGVCKSSEQNPEEGYKRNWGSLETYDFIKASANCPPQVPLDLIFPEVNIRRESILFSSYTHTQETNNALAVWNVVVTYCPYILTGVDPNSYSKESGRNGLQSKSRDVAKLNDNEKRPLARIYNMCFVRIPTICAGLVYTKNLMEGYPLVVDVGFIGDGPVEISPILVFLVLASILR